MHEAEKFGSLVRATRRTRKLRLGELAEKANTGVKHLGRIERGEKQPSFDLIIDLANALDVPPSTFFDFDQVEPDVKTLKVRLTQLLNRQDAGTLLRISRVLQTFLT